MISNQILQASIDDLRNITRIDFGIYDLNCEEVVSTSNMQRPHEDIIGAFIQSPADSQIIGNYHLLKVSDDRELTYVLVAIGFGDDVYTIGRIAAVQIERLITAYKERFDRNNFFQNLLLDNLLLVDIFNRSKELHIDMNMERVVFVISSAFGYEKTSILKELLQNIFSPQNGDYITSVDENSIILIKAIENHKDTTEMEQVAHTIVDMANTELLLNVKVAYGTIVQELKDLSKSYKEAKMALDVGQIFYFEKNVLAYSTLGIGRLIYQLPISLCNMFIEEIFGSKVPEEFDDEILTTVNKFFENSLNISETSRQLFVHRNTLVYRIEKIQKSTGLDIRIFEEALTFKIALMVVNYMKYLDHLDY
ncbi:MAG: helix-turn-helix domain-containing protein [Lachnospiraceae bacterium]